MEKTMTNDLDRTVGCTFVGRDGAKHVAVVLQSKTFPIVEIDHVETDDPCREDFSVTVASGTALDELCRDVAMHGKRLVHLRIHVFTEGLDSPGSLYRRIDLIGCVGPEWVSGNERKLTLHSCIAARYPITKDVLEQRRSYITIGGTDSE